MTKEREAIYQGGSTLVNGYRLSVSSVGDGTGAFMHIGLGGAHLTMVVSVEDIRAYAAQLIDTAEEVEAERIAKMDPEGDFVRDELKGNFKPVK